MILLLVLLQTAIFIHKSGLVNCSSSQTGPIFIKEPTNTLRFMNTNGAKLDCLAYGNPPPKISWLKYEDQNKKSLVHDIKNVVQVLENGTLIFRTFPSDGYIPSVHANTYVCQASNVHGLIVSADINVRAATEEQQQQIQAQVYDTYVMPGNTAVLKCNIPTFMNNGLKVVAWIREDNLVIKSENPVDGYAITSEGNLHINSVYKETNSKLGYWCQVKNSLSGKIFLSQSAGRVVITVPQGGVKPTITDMPKYVYVDKGTSFTVICSAQGYPVPEIMWTFNTSDIILSKESSFVVTDDSLSGTKYIVCRAQNKYGQDITSIEVIFKEKLHAAVSPSLIKVNSYKSASFICRLEGYPVEELKWVHNGREISNSSTIQMIGHKLIINSVGREQEGMYQCFISNKWDAAQSTAQLILESVAPEFIQTFESKITQPGPSISLKCVADGLPKPTIRWTFNGKNLEENQRFTLEKNDLTDASVESILTVKNIRTRDGGVYACIAQNKNDIITSSNTIYVYGLPYIHPLLNKTVAAGEDTYLECYVSGYPISSVTWEKVGSNIILQQNLKDFRNGTLMILKMMKNMNEGSYACIADNGRGQKARETLHIKGLDKPVIRGALSLEQEVKWSKPFTTFCHITSGDGVINMNWLKNGRPNILGKGIDISTTKHYSVLQIREVKENHAGNYSCVAENSVGSDMKTVVLKVLSAPKWKSQPENVISVVGQSVVSKCQGGGHPAPKSQWYKIVGKNVLKIESENSNNQTKVDVNGTLHIENIRLDDAGNYSCIVSNGISPNLISQSYIKVLNTVKIIFINESASYAIGKQITLFCKASGIGTNDISWTKNDELLLNSHKWDIKADIQEDEARSSLTFKFDINSSGRYNCHAKNERESTTQFVDLLGLHSTNESRNILTLTNNVAPSTKVTSNTVFTTTASTSSNTPLILLEEGQAATQFTNEETPKIGENKASNKNNFDSPIDFSRILFIAPAAIVVILLIALIVTFAIYISMRRKNSRQKHERGFVEEEVEICTNGTLKSKNASTHHDTLDRRYGRLEHHHQQGNQSSNHNTESNNYEIPDYYAETQPYATLQLSSRFRPDLELDKRNIQSSV